MIPRNNSDTHLDFRTWLWMGSIGNTNLRTTDLMSFIIKKCLEIETIIKKKNLVILEHQKNKSKGYKELMYN